MDFSTTYFIKYRACAIISRGLYTFYSILEEYFFVFKEFFQKILSLCMASILEQFLIKSKLGAMSSQNWGFQSFGKKYKLITQYEL